MNDFRQRLRERALLALVVFMGATLAALLLVVTGLFFD